MGARVKNEVRFCEKLTDVYIFFIITVFSLFCFPDYGSITEWKFRMFFWSTVIYTAFLLVGCLELHLVGSTADLPRLSKCLNITFFSLGAYLLLSVFSFIFSEHKEASLFGGGKFDGLVSVILYAAVFLLVSLCGRLKTAHALAFIPVVFLNFVLVILQFFGLNPMTLYPDGMNYHDAFRLYANEFLGTFGNVDLLSAFLSLSIPLFLALSVFGDKKYRALFLVSLVPATFCLFLCKVYSGIVGVFASAFLLVFYIREKNDFRIFIRSLSLIIISALSALLLLEAIPLWLLIVFTAVSLSGFLPYGFNRKVFLTIFCTAFVTFAIAFLIYLLNNQNSDSGRLRIWRDAVRIFLNDPLLGSGPGTFLNECSFTFERYSEELGFNIKSSIDAAHNIYLHILACMGLPALTSFLAFVFSVIKKAKSSPLLFPIISYLVCSFFSFEVCSVSAIFYIICGLAVCDIHPTKK